VAGRQGAGVTALGVGLFVGLAVLSVAAFAITRAARSGDDIVNTVELTPRLEPGGEAEITFNLTEADGDAEVLIIEPLGGPVRALASGAALDAGPQRFTWDGLTDGGEAVPPGPYALRVVLGDQGREIEPPGRIRFAGGTGGGSG